MTVDIHLHDTRSMSNIHHGRIFDNVFRSDSTNVIFTPLDNFINSQLVVDKNDLKLVIFFF